MKNKIKKNNLKRKLFCQNMRRYSLIFFNILFLVFLPLSVHAQNRSLSGVIKDKSDEPIIGATIKLLGSNKGTVSDLDGKFIISIPQTAVLNITYIGYKSQNIKVNASTTLLNITMEEESLVLKEQVVTALDMRRDEKTLTYGRQAVDAGTMTEARDANMLNMLSGKVSGVQVISGGGPGSSTTIHIRGMNSITGNNQPLYVIDGIPIMNDMGDNNSEFLDYGNAAANINPDDIESIEVLKGANASALYGSDAANGVILITTKKAKKKNGWGVTLNSNVQFTELNQKPIYQNIYGTGYDGRLQQGLNYYGNTSGGAVYDSSLPWGIANLTNQSYNQRSFGPPMLGFDVVGRNGVIKSFSPHPESILNMYKTGTEFTNSVAFDKLTDGGSIRFSYTNTTSDDILENFNERNRNAFSLKTTSKITKYFTVDVNGRYTYDKMDNRGYRNNSSRNPLYSIANLTRDYSPSELTPWKQDNGKPFTLVSGITNPYWLLNELSNSDEKHWLLADITLKYDITKELNARVRGATDIQSSQGWSFINLYSQFDVDGDYSTFSQTAKNNTFEATLTHKKKWSKFTHNISIGVYSQSMENKKENIKIETLMKADEKSLSNIGSGSYPKVWENYSAKEKRSVFGTGNLGYKDFLYVDLTARNDWSSTLPKHNNSYFYSSAGASFLLSEVITIPKRILSFAKLRASIASVGNDAQFNKLYNGYTFGGTYLNDMKWYSSKNTKGNPNLKPEQTLSKEIGADLRFWNNRIILDVTYYSKSTTDQIVEAAVSPMSGYERKLVNAGEIKNWGTEILLSIKALKLSKFEWTTTLNWSQNKSEVVSLTETTNRFAINSFGQYVTTYAQVGQSYPVMYGAMWKRDDEGNLLVDANGRTITENDQYIGKVSPDWFGGWNNEFKIGNVQISALLDFQKGGLFWSYTDYQGTRDGNTVKSLEGRDEYLFSNWVLGENDNERKGQLQVVNTNVPGANLTDKYVSYHDNTRISGVNLPNRIFDESVTYWAGQPCYMNVKPTNFWSDDVAKDMKQFTHDASYIKLREVTIGYNLPSKLIRKTPLRSVKVSAVGRNLAILYQKTPKGIDPQATSTTGSGQGFEYGFVLPTATYGFNVNVSF